MMHRVAHQNPSKAGGGKNKMKLLILALSLTAVYAHSFTPTCKKNVYCNSKLLHDVQMARILPDSKDFVDLHMKINEQDILSNFGDLLNVTHNHPSREQLLKFVTDHFDTVSELENWKPLDFNPEPEFLKTIKDPRLRQFAKDIVNIWPTLGRKVKPIVFEKPEYFSMIPVKNGFIIPGGRFKELYYWDTYWIIEGLLVSGMKDTVKGIISNLIDLQRSFGHVPNGNRYYYQERSQPPLLSAMMAIYIQETNDIQFLKDNIDALESELEYWLHTHSVVFKVAGKEYTLLRYYAPSDGPRPESYYEDYTYAEKLHTEQKQRQFYTDIKSAAESGWDFSSRWLINQNGSNVANRTEIRTTDIIPVDLNAIFANSLQILARFKYMLHNERKGVDWGLLSRQWIKNIQEVLFNQEDGIWYDYDLSNSLHRKYFYPSNISPLWMGVVEPGFVAAKAHGIVEYLKKVHSLEYPGGVPTSLIRSGEQWDFPNASPPLISIIVSALEALQTKESSRLAFEIAQNWVRSNYKGYLTNRQLYEKYDVEKPGKSGSGGEYPVQTGYGWTIGAILELLYKYGSTMTYQDSLYQNFNYGTLYPSQSGYYASSPQQSTLFSSGYQTYNKQQWIKPGYVTEVPAKYASIAYASPTPQYIAEIKPEYVPPPKVVYVSSTQKPLLAYSEAIPTAEVKPVTVPSLQVKPEYIPTPTRPEYIVKPQYVSPTFVSAPVKPEYSLLSTLASPESKPEVALPTLPSPEIKLDHLSISQAKPEYISSVYYKPQQILVSQPKPEYKPEYVTLTPIKAEYQALTEVKPEFNPQVQHKPEYAPFVSTAQSKPEHISEVVAVAPAKPEYSAQINSEYTSKPEYKPVQATTEYVAPIPLSIQSKPEHVSTQLNHAAYVKPSYSLPAVSKPVYAPAKPEYISSAKPTSEYPAEHSTNLYVQAASTEIPLPPASVGPTYLPSSSNPLNIPTKPAYGFGAHLDATSPQVLYSTESYVQPLYQSTPAQIKEHTSYPLSTEYTSAPLQDEYATSTTSKPEYSTSSLTYPEYSTTLPLEDEYITTIAPLSETTQLSESPVVSTNPAYRPEYVASGQQLNASVESQNAYNSNSFNASLSNAYAQKVEEITKVSSENSASSVFNASATKFPSVFPIRPVQSVTYTSSTPVLTPALPLPVFPSKPVNASVHYSGVHREPVSLSHYSYNHGVNVFNTPFVYSTPAPVQTVYVSSSPVKHEEISLVPHVAYSTPVPAFPPAYHEFSHLVPTHNEQIITTVSEQAVNKTEVPVKVEQSIATAQEHLSSSSKPLDASFVTYQLNSKPGYVQNAAHNVVGYASTSKPAYFTSNQQSYSLEHSGVSKPEFISSLPANSVFGTNTQNLFYTAPVKHTYHGIAPAFGYTARPYYNSGQYTGQYKHSYIPSIKIKQVNVVPPKV